MQEQAIPPMPTGIVSLDPVLMGGMPPGSVILLLGDIGAGNSEFVYSSILSLSTQKTSTQTEKKNLPEEICYITFTKTSEDVAQEMALSFHPDLVAHSSLIHYEDLSKLYFDASIVPVDWYSKTDILSRIQSRGETTSIMAHLASQLNNVSPNSLIVLDSITDIATQYANKPQWGEFSAFLKGLQRISKQWNSTIFLILTKGILDKRQELEIADAADAVLLFRWEETAGSRRQRIMYIEKFRGLMTHLEDRDLVKFAVKISSSGGFEVSNIRVVL
ncbi:MAG TPA: ATPase domain-containing protein [Methanoregulaceae archaeon]|nr:ATPase domain-containing protein [Methanoregulaceae archaeon]